MAGGNDGRWAQAAAFAGALAVLIVVASGWLRIVLVVLACVIGIPSGLSLIAGLPVWHVIAQERRQRRERESQWAARTYFPSLAFDLIGVASSHDRALTFQIRNKTRRNVTTFYADPDQNPEGKSATCSVETAGRTYQATIPIRNLQANVPLTQLRDEAGNQCPLAQRYAITWTAPCFPTVMATSRIEGDRIVPSRQERAARALRRRFRRIRHYMTGV